jgi:hypothetical protein
MQVFIGTVIWILLQISRFIAVILIGDVNEGLAAEAWRYPAYLDLFRRRVRGSVDLGRLYAPQSAHLDISSCLLGHFNRRSRRKFRNDNVCWPPDYR